MTTTAPSGRPLAARIASGDAIQRRPYFYN